MVEISDQSCAVLGSRANRSWPRRENFLTMCHSYLRIHYLVVPPEFSLNKKMLKFFLLVYKRTNSISYA